MVYSEKYKPSIFKTTINPPSNGSKHKKHDIKKLFEMLTKTSRSYVLLKNPKVAL